MTPCIKCVSVLQKWENFTTEYFCLVIAIIAVRFSWQHDKFNNDKRASLSVIYCCAMQTKCMWTLWRPTVCKRFPLFCTEIRRNESVTHSHIISSKSAIDWRLLINNDIKPVWLCFCVFHFPVQFFRVKFALLSKCFLLRSKTWHITHIG